MTDARTLMSITDLAWQDILHEGEGSELGVIMIVIHRDSSDKMATQIAATVPPEIVEYAVKEIAKTWRARPADFVKIVHERKKIV